MSSIHVTTDTDLKQSMVLRRYLDLPKFLDLLHSQCLYLPRADGFADRLEGALFPGLRASMNAAHKAPNCAFENGRADKRRAFGKRPWRRAA